MTNNTPAPKHSIPINRKLFACIDQELRTPIAMPGAAYYSDKEVFEDEHGDKHDMGYFYSKEVPLVCPKHPNQKILCRAYIEYASSLGFYCKECKINYWSLSLCEIPCRECGAPVYHGFLGQYGICGQCDHSDNSGLDFHETDIIL